jgi:hypothetical protein
VIWWRQLITTKTRALSRASCTYCKRQDGEKHEFLVTEIIHQPTGLTNTVIVHRRAPQASSDDDSVTHTSHKISSKVAHNLVRIGGIKELHDITRDFRPFKILSTRTFTSPPSLLEFAILIVVVHEHAPRYDIIQHQSCWYSDTIWQVLGNNKYTLHTKESKD